MRTNRKSPNFEKERTPPIQNDKGVCFLNQAKNAGTSFYYFGTISTTSWTPKS